jgi:hypothetical protein
LAQRQRQKGWGEDGGHYDEKTNIPKGSEGIVICMPIAVQDEFVKFFTKSSIARFQRLCRFLSASQKSPQTARPTCPNALFHDLPPSLPHTTRQGATVLSKQTFLVALRIEFFFYHHRIGDTIRQPNAVSPSNAAHSNPQIILPKLHDGFSNPASYFSWPPYLRPSVAKHHSLLRKSGSRKLSQLPIRRRNLGRW